jgi:hypothetical protein
MATVTARRQVAPASDRRRAGESHYKHQPGNRAELFFNPFVLSNAIPNDRSPWPAQTLNSASRFNWLNNHPEAGSRFKLVAEGGQPTRTIRTTSTTRTGLKFSGSDD